MAQDLKKDKFIRICYYLTLTQLLDYFYVINLCAGKRATQTSGIYYFPSKIDLFC